MIKSKRGLRYSGAEAAIQAKQKCSPHSKHKKKCNETVSSCDTIGSPVLVASRTHDQSRWNHSHAAMSAKGAIKSHVFHERYLGETIDRKEKFTPAE